MKRRTKKAILATVATIAAIGLFAGCSNDEPAQTMANTERNTYQSARVDNTNPPGGAAPEENRPPDTVHADGMTITNTSFEGVEVNPLALSMEEAARIGAQYILDIFGESIDGMYVELEFSAWEHMTRPLWNGAVSTNNRNTLGQRAWLNELNEKFMARYNAGESMEDIQADMMDLFLEHTYTPARFYFAIDAITGKRINMWKPAQETLNQPVAEPMAMEEYIEREWGGDWTAAFEAEITPQEEEELSQRALIYAQGHFNTTAVVSVEFSNANASLSYAGNGNFNRESFATFIAIDETGREATISIGVRNRALNSISTGHNDFIPMEFEYYRGFGSEEEGYGGGREAPIEQRDEE